jgi:hypothetical protein
VITIDSTDHDDASCFIWMKSAQGWVSVPDAVKALEG